MRRSIEDAHFRGGRSRWTAVAGLSLGLMAAGAAADTPAAPPEIHITPGSPPAPERLRRMRSWHESAYAPRLAPVVAAWGRAEDDLAHWSRRGRAPGCRGLANALDTLRLEGLLPTPDWTVSRHLQSALWRIARGATACVDGRYFDARYHFDEARRLWRALDRRLAPYSLAAELGPT